jgi:hypothetical protein
MKAESANGNSIAFTKEGGGHALRGFLEPFKPKADLDYQVQIEGGIKTHGRAHETLVNSFAAWLRERGVSPARNAAVDLGVEDPQVIIEAKEVKSWSLAIRQAIGQLYEYRFFGVAAPGSALVFLSSLPVPPEWTDYLERDRQIAVVWKTPDGFFLTPRASKAFQLPKAPVARRNG